MTHNSITYHDDSFHNDVTVALGWRYSPEQKLVGREQGDIALSRMLAIDCPLKLCILIRADGRIDEWYAEFKGSANPHWHFDHGSEEYAFGRTTYPFSEDKPLPGHAPTEEQRTTLGRIFYGNVTPFGLRASLGAPVSRWAFAGMDVREMEQRFNDGQRGYYTRPTPDNDRDDYITRQERALENACEDGQISGAAPADL